MKTRKYFKFKPRELDTHTFEGLYSILSATLCHGNLTMVAKVLGVSRTTAIRYSTRPPKAYWWNQLLINVMDDLIAELMQSTNKLHKQWAYQATRLMSEYRQKTKEKGLLEADVTSNSEARRHILSLFRDRDEITTRMIRKPKYSGGYAQRTLIRALESLELDKETRGFGEDKVTYYRLPDGD